MKTIRLFFVITLALIIVFIVLNCSNKKEIKGITNEENLTEVIEEGKPVELSLFNRLGGTEGISLIVDDIVQAHLYR